MAFSVYILASTRNGTLYIGQTDNLARRIYEHRNELVQGFTQQYNVKTLVHVEVYDRLEEARERERRLKDWKRNWKLELIEQHNPDWRDLSEDI